MSMRRTAPLLGILAAVVALQVFAANALTCTDTSGNLFSFTPAGTVTPPPVTPPPPASGVVYSNGVFSWGGDWSYSVGKIDYADTVGNAPGLDIAVPITAPWGGWQPYAIGKVFDVTPYKYLTFAAKPTKPGQYYGAAILAANDTPDGVGVDVNGKPQYGNPSVAYGPLPQVGVWAVYKIPLADFKLTTNFILKFHIADGTGVTSNLFYVKDVSFVP